jgi:hypothetical protein
MNEVEVVPPYGRQALSEELGGDGRTLDENAPVLQQALAALWWLLDMLDGYDERLAAIDGADRVYSPIHVEAKTRTKRVLERVRAAALLRSPLCTMGDSDPVIGRYFLPQGCIALPDAREMNLCYHHVCRSEPLGEMYLIEAYDPIAESLVLGSPIAFDQKAFEEALGRYTLEYVQKPYNEKRLNARYRDLLAVVRGKRVESGGR